ncbi:MAG: globin [Actinomycetes bacterium]
MSDASGPRPMIPVTPARHIPEVDADAPDTVSVFTAVGGQAFFDDLVGRFYGRVAVDPVLLPLYPDADDLGPAADRLAKFLAQYWGGPAIYSEERGHPRLRMRHVPYAIGTAERDAWLAAMLESLNETMPGTPLDDELRVVVHNRMTEYFTLSAQHLVNTGD